MPCNHDETYILIKKEEIFLFSRDTVILQKYFRNGAKHQ